MLKKYQPQQADVEFSRLESKHLYVSFCVFYSFDGRSAIYDNKANVNTAKYGTAFGKYDRIAIAIAPSDEVLDKALLIIGAMEL